MTGWVAEVNSWAPEQKPCVLYFGSWTSWLLLYYTYRLFFKIDYKIVPTFELGYIEFFASSFYAINFYVVENDSVYYPCIIIYTILYYLTYGYYLIRPVNRMYFYKTRIGNKKLIWFILLVFALIHNILYTVFESFAEAFTFNDFYGTHWFNQAVLPRFFIMVISTIAWFIIINKHLKPLREQLKKGQTENEKDMNTALLDSGITNYNEY